MKKNSAVFCYENWVISYIRSLNNWQVICRICKKNRKEIPAFTVYTIAGFIIVFRDELWKALGKEKHVENSVVVAL